MATPRHKPAAIDHANVSTDKVTPELISFRKKKIKIVKKSKAGISVRAIPTAGHRNGTANSVVAESAALNSGAWSSFAMIRSTAAKQTRFTQRTGGACKPVSGESDNWIAA